MIHKIDASYKTFTPSKGYLLITTPAVEEEVTSQSGIVIERVRSKLDRPCYGEVLASGVKSIKVGSTVVFPNTDGIDVEFTEGEGFMLLRKASVIGVVTPSEQS